MSFNGSGLFVINSSGQPVVSTTLIESAVFNAFTADIGTGLSTAICKDGQTTITANIPFNAFKITGLANGSSLQDATTVANIINGTGVYVATVGGTADVITLTPSPAITAYAAGQTFRFLASGANTTNVTVNVSALGAKALTKNGTTALVAGDLPAGMMATITYDGTRFILTGFVVNSSLLVAKTSSTGSAVLPVGTTGERDGSPANGYFRFNSTTGNFEGYNSGAWMSHTEKTSNTGSAVLPVGTTAERDGSPTNGYLRYNTTTSQFEGYSGAAWSSVGGAEIANDTSTGSLLYPLFSSATSGTATTVKTSNAKLLYQPSTGELQSTVLNALNGLVVNAQTISTSYTIAATNNAMSAGPVAVGSGVTITVSSGARWVVV